MSLTDEEMRSDWFWIKMCEYKYSGRHQCICGYHQCADCGDGQPVVSVEASDIDLARVKAVQEPYSVGNFPVDDWLLIIRALRKASVHELNAPQYEREQCDQLHDLANDIENQLPEEFQDKERW